MAAKQYKYIVKRPFKYGKRSLKAGDEWTPGSKVPDRDKRIIDGDYYVSLVEVKAPAKTRRKRATRSKANG